MARPRIFLIRFTLRAVGVVSVTIDKRLLCQLSFTSISAYRTIGIVVFCPLQNIGFPEGAHSPDCRRVMWRTHHHYQLSSKRLEDNWHIVVFCPLHTYPTHLYRVLPSSSLPTCIITGAAQAETPRSSAASPAPKARTRG